VFKVVVFPLLHHAKPTAEDSTILCNIGKTFYYHCDPYVSYVHEEPVLDIFRYHNIVEIEGIGKISKVLTSPISMS